MTSKRLVWFRDDLRLSDHSALDAAAETSAPVMFWNEIPQAPHQAAARQVEAALASDAIGSQNFPGDLLAVPSNIRTGDNRALRVFTPFWRRADRAVAARLASGLRDSWKPGEASAQARLRAFLEDGVAGNAGDRDRPDRDGTSGLSPHLRFGEISPRQI